MNLSSEKKEYIETVLDDRTLGHLYPILEVGQIASRDFFNKNSDFFDVPEFLNNVPGHILTYCINKQLAPSKIPQRFPFRVTCEEINKNNKNCAPFLKKGLVSISILRCRNRGKLDSSDKNYLKRKCKSNNILDGQLTIFEEKCSSDEAIHGVLIYGSQRATGGFEFADIVFFDSTLRNVIFSIDIMDKLKIYRSQIDDGEKQKNLLNAENLIKEVKREMGV